MGRKKDPRGAMHVAKIRSVHGDKIYDNYLIRRSFREDGKVKHETVANISRLPPSVIDLIRRALQGEALVPLDRAFAVRESRHHGHVQAVRLAMQRLGMANLLASRPSRERDLVVGMIGARILSPDSKLGNTRWWATTTLPEELSLGQVDVDELYGALDWLLDHQDRIEKKLAGRHLEDGGSVLYDLSSSYFEGTTCPLAALGHNRDGKKGKLQIYYGLVTDIAGRPIAIRLYPGNTGDSTTSSINFNGSGSGLESSTWRSSGIAA